jgi:enhancer of polycomb-like protein
LLHDQDQQSLLTDNSLTVTGPDGRMQSIIPYRLGLQQPMIRRDAQIGQRPMGVHPSQGGVVPMSLTMPNGTPISVQTQLKKMQPPVGMSQPQQRISSNGGMRPPATPVVASMSSNPLPTQSSSPQMPPPPAPQSTNGINGTNRSPSRAPEGEAVKAEPSSNSMPNGTSQSQPDINTTVVDHRMSVPVRPPMEPNSPTRPKSSQNQHLTVPMQNGYHVASMNGFSAMPNGSPYMHIPNS